MNTIDKTSTVVVGMNQSVKSWYTTAHPSDELGSEIREELTFDDLYKVLQSNNDVYAALDVSDSVVRERVFEQLSSILKVPYKTIYDLWLSDTTPNTLDNLHIKHAGKVFTSATKVFISEDVVKTIANIQKPVKTGTLPDNASYTMFRVEGIYRLMIGNTMYNLSSSHKN